MNRSLLCITTLGLISTLLLGCNKRGLQPVEGVITYDGQALPDAAITLLPIHGQPATALTDAEGRFQVSSNNDRGAAVGQYKVLVFKYEPEDKPQAGIGKTMSEATPAELTRVMGVMGPSTRKSLIPTMYTDATQTPLSLEVPVGGLLDVQLTLNSVAEKK